jgi:ribosomal protein L16 Arg81 hydroxylase
MIEFGVPAAQFREQIFERRLHLQRSALQDNSIEWRDIDELLERLEPRAPDVKLFREGVVPEDSYVEDTVEVGVRRRRFNKAGFYSQMRLGATLILNRFEFQSSLAKRLCSSVARYSGMQTTSNAYLSFGGRGSFGKHWDTHDVFAVQLLGRKRWQIFEPTFPCPLSHQSSDKMPQTASYRPVLDLVLEAGDMLYVPRGWWHRTIPFDEGSLHVSVGAYATTLYDYILWTCARELSQITDARRGFQIASENAGSLSELMELVREAVLDPGKQQQFKGETIARERVHSDFDVELFLGRGGKVLSPDATVRLTSHHPPKLERDEILINGARLRLDATNHAIVTALANGATVEVRALQTRLHGLSLGAISAGLLALATREIVTIEEDSLPSGGVTQLARVSQ